ncbi:hypothetical protein PIROE2DRAFT_12353 [Piromyces sp. E2]|nr:hypothetical protein PIROE2DRAFT_12353 [Piromyces sp. E2]|eukprot:OUM61614.1 hypothetical protein PIROE2DRAFT_12353 [Piromyces sp. E2]
MSALEQLKKYTTVVSDTGDFEGLEYYASFTNVNNMEQKQKQLNSIMAHPEKNMSNSNIDMSKLKNMDSININELDKLIVSFERSAFMNPGFSPETFLMDRRHIELNKIKKDLHEHLKELKVELVELINHNYTDFIDLSTILVGTDKLINNLKYPLINMRRDVEDVKNIYQEVITELETKLNKRSELREKKACLQLYININNSIKKIEELLKTVTELENNQTMLLDCKKIERIAIEYNQLQYFVDKGKGLKFISNIDWKITKIKDNILSNLEDMLTRSLNGLQGKKEKEDEELEQLLVQCLRTYELIDKIEEVEDIIRKVLVKPFIAKPPTKYSIWVPTIFQSLHSFLDQYKSMDDSIKKEWVNKVVTDVTICYTACVNDTLKAVRELEGSLKRLKKVKKGGFNSSNGSLNLFTGNKEMMSDEDKIRLQMELDVQQYGEELKKLGFDIITNLEYKELLKSTKEPASAN